VIRSLNCAAMAAALVVASLSAAPAPVPSSSQQPQAQSPPPGQAPPQPLQPTFRGSADVVRVFVTVTDRDGRLVTNLTKDDFEIRDDGKPQQITAFDNTPLPIRLVAMLDVSGSMSGNLQLLRASSEQLFVRLKGGDGARVGSFGHEVTISEAFTNDPDKLHRALPDSIAPDAPTPLWRAVDDAMAVLRPPKDDEKKEDADARPVVLVLSDGKDSGPIGFQVNKRYVGQMDVIERARNESVMVYGIGMRSRQSRPQMPGLGPQGLMNSLTADMPDPGLAKVAEETGGGYLEVRLGQDLGAAFAHVADELHSQYLIGYPPPKRDGKVHKIEVKVTQRGLEPRARRTYVAAKS
jgi:Ca-activated chloride channel family protein